jgi:uncharacterized protein YndB with AHSA1/START domain
VTNPLNTNTDLARFPPGTATRTGDQWVLRFVREYPHPLDRVWRSITDPQETKLWWAESRIDLRLGGRFDLRWLNGPDGQPLDWWPGAITALEAPHLIEHTNSEHGLLRWELERIDGGTRLTFTNTITPSEQRFVAMSLGGWHAHLDHLVESIEGRPPHWPTWYDEFGKPWEVLRQQYRAALPLSAG